MAKKKTKPTKTKNDAKDSSTSSDLLKGDESKPSSSFGSKSKPPVWDFNDLNNANESGDTAFKDPLREPLVFEAEESK